MANGQDLNSDSRMKLMQVALNRSDLYQLLAIAFRDPTPELVEGLLSGTFRADAADCVQWLNADSVIFDQALSELDSFAVDNAGRDSEQILHEMQVEYFRLFIGSKEPAVFPYHTMYSEERDGFNSVLFTSPTAQATEKAYKDAGVSLVSVQAEPPDHIATELEFLMYLCAQEAAAWKNGDIDQARKRRRQEREFVDEFLGKWIFSFCRAITEKSNNEAYKAFASLAKAYLQVEQGVFVPR